jgi:hypothetical protein
MLSLPLLKVKTIVAVLGELKFATSRRPLQWEYANR